MRHLLEGGVYITFSLCLWGVYWRAALNRGNTVQKVDIANLILKLVLESSKIKYKTYNLTTKRFDFE